MLAGVASEPARAGVRLSFIKDEAIYLQNDHAAHWYEVVDGIVRTCCLQPDGRRQLTAFHVAGDVFGVDPFRYRATAEAVTAEVVLRRYKRSPGQSNGSSELPLSQALEKAEARVRLLGRRGAPERLAAFLLDLRDRTGGGAVLQLPMTRRDIADHLGLNIETVSRTISDLVRRKLIELEGPHCLRITDAARLVSLAGVEDEVAFSRPPPCLAGSEPLRFGLRPGC
jgi:CRP/FNR family nitrogen fixation transcriptional regulator